MSVTLDQRCRKLLEDLGLASGGEVDFVEPLTGGVASDIAMIGVGSRRYCAKFALAKLKVAAEWLAPVHRNKAEYAWLEAAASIAPDHAVRLFGRSETENGFVMEYLQGDGVFLWKTALLQEAPAADEAARVGDYLGRIHAASAAAGFDRSPFQNRDDFLALRIEPYLLYTADRCPDVADDLTAMADELYNGDLVLVHGDVSPKNIFFRDGHPLFLDAECATMGDASFDPAFCLNHLVLKAVHLPGSRGTLLQGVLDFWRAYAAHVQWESAAGLEARICRLLPALMLARVDGKSPVEYFGDGEKETVRRLSRPLIRCPRSDLRRVVEDIAGELKG